MSKYYGQFEPPFDKILKEKYLGNIENGIGIECGAFDGVTECNLKYFEDNQYWKIYNIEASPPVYNLLSKNRPKSYNFNLGLSDIENIISFTHTIHPILHNEFGNGSFSHNPIHYNQLVSMGCKFVNYQVNTITYKKFIEDNNIEKLNCFVLDVEGYELQVIDGMKDSKVLPELFMIEYPLIGLEILKNKINQIFPNLYILDNIYHNSAFFIKK